MNRWQAIIWTNADPINWRIDAELGEMRSLNMIEYDFFPCPGYVP